MNQPNQVFPDDLKRCKHERECNPNQVCCKFSFYCKCEPDSIWDKSTKSCKKCEPGWVYNLDTGLCYYVSGVNQLANWTEAFNNCLSNSSLLINLDDSTGTGYPIQMMKFIGSIEWNLDFFWVFLFFLKF